MDADCPLKGVNIPRRITTYGPEHPEVATDVNNLGSVLQDKGDFDGAQAAYERVLAIGEATFDPSIRMSPSASTTWAAC